MHAARCPAPAASDDVVLIPELPSPGMLMTDGTHGATGITVIDGRLILLRPPQAVAVVAPPGAFQLARRGGLRATADLSKRTIVAGHGPACLASQIPAIADGPGRGQARTAPAAPTLLGFSREMPGFHPRTVRVFIPGAPNKNPHSPGN